MQACFLALSHNTRFACCCHPLLPFSFFPPPFFFLSPFDNRANQLCKAHTLLAWVCCRAVRLLHQGKARRSQSDCKMEKGVCPWLCRLRALSQPIETCCEWIPSHRLTSLHPHHRVLHAFGSAHVCVPQPGYESLCCLACIQTRDSNHGTTCICRVPRSKLSEVRCSITSTGLAPASAKRVPLAMCWLTSPRCFVFFLLLLPVDCLGVLQGTKVECVRCGCRGCGH